MAEYRDIRTAKDITEDHVLEAADLREGCYGEPLPWDEVINHLEHDSGEDWGSDLGSEAIAELKRRVRKELEARRG